MWLCNDNFFSIVRVWSQEEGREERRRAEERKGKWGRTKKERMTEGWDAQVLLLMDPGAELGWAELSDTLPSCEAGDVCARA